MHDPVIFVTAFAAAIVWLFAMIVLFRRGAALDGKLLALGLVLLGLEIAIAGWAAGQLLPENTARTYRVRQVSSSLVPGVWFAIALVHARENYRSFLRRWKHALAAMLIIIPVVAVASWPGLARQVLSEVDRWYWPVSVGLPSALLSALDGLICLLALFHVFCTLREAPDPERHIVAWFAGGFAVLMGPRILLNLQLIAGMLWRPETTFVSAACLFVAAIMLARAEWQTSPPAPGFYVSTHPAYAFGRSLAGKAVSRVLGMRPAGHILATRQAEAIQMMSAFLAHDLKNTAASMSLTLDNLPRYVDNQQFRDDAMRTFSTGVTKINEIVQRLAGLRRRVELHPQPVEFRAWYAEAMQAFDAQWPGLVQWREPPARRVRMDPEQVRSVLQNLVANAKEASAHGVPVQVSAENRNGSVLIRVRDHGAGMSREFIANRLFRPFQTTKPDGMGIGLFQSRMIIEAHGGHMEVESEPGEGTSFHVILPAET